MRGTEAKMALEDCFESHPAGIQMCGPEWAEYQASGPEWAGFQISEPEKAGFLMSRSEWAEF